MSPRARVVVIVAVAAALAAALVVGAVRATTTDAGDRGAAAEPPRGAPPLLLDLAVRADPEAVALRRASALYSAGKRNAAASIFDRYDSIEAQVGSAVARWPSEALARLELLGQTHPRRGVVQLHLGFARAWSGRRNAEEAFRAAARVEPDTPYAVFAGNVLHPEYVRGVPIFAPTFGPPSAVSALPPARQLDALARGARTRSARAKILYGVALQRLGRQRSALRQYDAAVAAAPNDPEANVAAAVVRFDKAKPARAFARLGPLTRRFPEAVTVRFHLGLLLAWSGQVREATRQFELARAQAPRSPLGRQAAAFLREFEAAAK